MFRLIFLMKFFTSAIKMFGEFIIKPLNENVFFLKKAKKKRSKLYDRNL